MCVRRYEDGKSKLCSKCEKIISLERLNEIIMTLAPGIVPSRISIGGARFFHYEECVAVNLYFGGPPIKTWEIKDLWKYSFESYNCDNYRLSEMKDYRVYYRVANSYQQMVANDLNGVSCKPLYENDLLKYFPMELVRIPTSFRPPESTSKSAVKPYSVI